jgi:hypothetical protein
MFNVRNIQKQIVSLVVLETIAFAGLAVVPSFAGTQKHSEAGTQKIAATDGEKLALIEGSVTHRQAPETVQVQTHTPGPMSLKEVESFTGASLGSFGAPGL